MNRIFVIAALAACGKGGAKQEQATPETETFIEALNGRSGVIGSAKDVRMNFGMTGPGDRCHYYVDTLRLVFELQKTATSLPAPSHVPGMKTCLDAVQNNVFAIVKVLADGTEGLGSGDDYCAALEPLWSKRTDAFKAAMCSLEKTRTACVAEAKAAGAATEIDELTGSCSTGAAPSSAPGTAPPGAPPGAPPMAPPAAPPKP